MHPDYEELEKAIGYHFSDKALLVRALTRKAYALEQFQQGKHVEDQDVLRTLGDAVLRLALVDLLIRRGYGTRGAITMRKSLLENESSLATMARRLGVGSCIRLGTGERLQGAADNQYVIAETLEALFGAIYLDGGYDISKKIIHFLMRDVV